MLSTVSILSSKMFNDENALELLDLPGRELTRLTGNPEFK